MVPQATLRARSVGADGYPVGCPPVPGVQGDGSCPEPEELGGGPVQRRSAPACVKGRAGRMAWCPSAARTARATGAETPAPPLGRATGHAWRSALRRGRTASRGMACYRTPGNDQPRERRPTRNGAGAPALVVSPTSASAISAPATVTACSRICGALRPLSCGCLPPGANGAVTDAPQLIALSARSERLSRSLSSWARSAGRSLGRLRLGRSGQPALRMLPRIGRSLMITQTFPMTEWSFEVHEWSYSFPC